MKLNKLFEIEYGQHEYNSKSNLIKGNIPLISSQGVDNGCYGFYNISSKYAPPLITVPRTGSIGEAFVQTDPCCVDDNCLVLLPKQKYKIEFLFYVASVIRHHKWRFMYGRQITPQRLGRLEVLNPDKFEIDLSFDELTKQLLPKKHKVKDIEFNQKNKEFLLSKLFDIESGEYHSVNNLKKGGIPLISCSDANNGIAGFYDIPIKKTHKNCITVAYDGKPLTTKYHDYVFSAYDNVGVLTPKFNMRKTTLIFITILLNIERWRFSYGRKCYKTKLEKLKIKLPVDKEGKIDEDCIEEIIKNRDLFNVFKNSK